MAIEEWKIPTREEEQEWLESAFERVKLEIIEACLEKNIEYLHEQGLIDSDSHLVELDGLPKIKIEGDEIIVTIVPNAGPEWVDITINLDDLEEEDSMITNPITGRRSWI